MIGIIVESTNDMKVLGSGVLVSLTNVTVVLSLTESNILLVTALDDVSVISIVSRVTTNHTDQSISHVH